MWPTPKPNIVLGFMVAIYEEVDLLMEENKLRQ
jgi:hypothetical protein